jgi:hypothetical protein
MPPGWQVIDGALVRVSGGAGGKGAGEGDDLITLAQFDNFELLLDWKIVDRAGNSGVILRAAEDAVTSWHTLLACPAVAGNHGVGSFSRAATHGVGSFWRAAN